jgi:hypothetical protein
MPRVMESWVRVGRLVGKTDYLIISGNRDIVVFFVFVEGRFPLGGILSEKQPKRPW